jgi:hypothetical protein
LSVDNVFVITMIFAVMAVPRIYQHRVLFWGILGALVMRGVMIAVGAELIARHHWILDVFGVFLLVTAVKMLVIREHSDPAQSIVVRWAKRWLPVTDQFHGEHFIIRAGSARSRKAAAPGVAPLPDAAVDRAVPGTLMLTPLALALILVEFAESRARACIQHLPSARCRCCTGVRRDGVTVDRAGDRARGSAGEAHRSEAAGGLRLRPRPAADQGQTLRNEFTENQTNST